MYLTDEECEGHPSEREYGYYIQCRFTDQTMKKQEKRLAEKLVQEDLDEEQPSLLTFRAQGVWGIALSDGVSDEHSPTSPQTPHGQRGKRESLQSTTDIQLSENFFISYCMDCRVTALQPIIR